MRIKQSISALYRSEWLDVATFVFVSACINCGHTAEEGIRRFQNFLNLDEDQLDTDSLKTSFYRSQRKFRNTMKEDRDNLKFLNTEIEENISEEKLKKCLKEALEEMRENKKKDLKT